MHNLGTSEAKFDSNYKSCWENRNMFRIQKGHRRCSNTINNIVYLQAKQLACVKGIRNFVNTKGIFDIKLVFAVTLLFTKRAHFITNRESCSFQKFGDTCPLCPLPIFYAPDCNYAWKIFLNLTYLHRNFFM